MFYHKQEKSLKNNNKNTKTSKKNKHIKVLQRKKQIRVHQLVTDVKKNITYKQRHCRNRRKVL